jgi:stress response protein YsnF
MKFETKVDTKEQFNIVLGKLKGDYAKVTAWMKRKQTYTRKEMVAYLLTLGKEPDACEYTATIMLSPRKRSGRGDCRGNVSNPWGHLAYNSKLERKLIFGIKEEQKFKLRYRDEALPPRRRRKKTDIVLEKTEKFNVADVKVPVQQLFTFFDLD